MLKKSFVTMIFLFSIWLMPNVCFSQVTIGSNKDADPNAALEIVSNGNKGLLLPRVALTSLASPSPLQSHVLGMKVFNTGAVLPQGVYVNDGAKWVSLSVDGNSVAWYSSAAQQAAASNTEGIYQQGNVAIGTTTTSAKAKLEVSSTNRGVLLPQLTTADRNRIDATTIPDGLLVYNTDIGCFNYYKAAVAGVSGGWISLCGSN